MKKYMTWLWKGLAIFGALVAAAIIVRSQKQAKATQTKFTDALANDVKKTTNFDNLAIIVLPVFASLSLMWAIGNDDVIGGCSMAIIWGSIAASVAGSFNITYVPQFIGFTISSAPTSFVINVQGDGVTFNLDATGITNMANIRYLGVISNQYVFQIADGLINGKNGTVTITNAAAAQLDVYAWSKQPGSFYNTYLTQNALANSGFELQNFAYAAFPSAAAGDSFTLEYSTGITQVSNRLDLAYALGYKQNISAAAYRIDNIAPATLKKVTFIPAAAQNIYAMKYQSQAGTVSASLMN